MPHHNNESGGSPRKKEGHSWKTSIMAGRVAGTYAAKHIYRRPTSSDILIPRKKPTSGTSTPKTPASPSPQSPRPSVPKVKQARQPSKSLDNIPSVAGNDYSSMISTRHRQFMLNRHLKPINEPMVLEAAEDSRHPLHNRVDEEDKKTFTTTLRAIEFTNNAVCAVRNQGKSLRRLNLSYLHLTTLYVDMLRPLTSLLRLDLRGNELTSASFPKDMAHHMPYLYELNLSYNKLAYVPSAILRLKQLTRLNVSYNELDHLDSVERLTKLRFLGVDNNSIRDLDSALFKQLKYLEILHASHNRIKNISGDIKFCGALQEINLSNNGLVNLASTLFSLRYLDYLDLSYNRLRRLPQVETTKARNTRIYYVDLSFNLLPLFPEFLGRLCKNLDLRNNEIKQISVKYLRQLLMGQFGPCPIIMLRGNPLGHTIPDELLDGQLKGLSVMLADMARTQKFTSGLKIQIFGEPASGKSTMISCLADSQQALIEPHVETEGVALNDLVLRRGADGLDMNVWEFGGDRVRYGLVHQLFLQSPALYIITFRLDKYSSARFYSIIGHWIEMLMNRFIDVPILLVGTFADLVTNDIARETAKTARSDANTFIAQRISKTTKERQRIDADESIPRLTKEFMQKNLHLLLKKAKTQLFTRAFPISSIYFRGYSDLTSEIWRITEQESFLMHSQVPAPSLFIDVQSYFEDMRYDMKLPILTKSRFTDRLRQKFDLHKLTDKLLDFLYNAGKIFTSFDRVRQKETIFLEPSWIAEVVSKAFSNNLKEDDFQKEPSLKEAGLTEELYVNFSKEFSHGMLDTLLLKALWLQSFPNGMKRAKEVLDLLIGKFDLGFMYTPDVSKGSVASMEAEVPQPEVKEEKTSKKKKGNADHSAETDSEGTSLDSTVSNSTISSQSTIMSGDDQGAKKRKLKKSETDIKTDVAATSLKSREKWVQQWHMPDIVPPSFELVQESFKDLTGAVALYVFPISYPEGFFEIVCARLSNMWMVPKLFWKTGYYACHKDQPVETILTTLNDEEHVKVVRIECRCARTEEAAESQEGVWDVLYSTLHAIEEIVQGFKGIFPKRYIECPNCKKPGFYGDWWTTGDALTSPITKCFICEEHVDPVMVSGSRDPRKGELKYTGSDLEKLREARRARIERVLMMHEEERLRQEMLAPQTVGVVGNQPVRDQAQETQGESRGQALAIKVKAKGTDSRTKAIQESQEAVRARKSLQMMVRKVTVRDTVTESIQKISSQHTRDKVLKDFKLILKNIMKEQQESLMHTKSENLHVAKKKSAPPNVSDKSMQPKNPPVKENDEKKSKTVTVSFKLMTAAEVEPEKEQKPVEKKGNENKGQLTPEKDKTKMKPKAPEGQEQQLEKEKAKVKPPVPEIKETLLQEKDKANVKGMGHETKEHQLQDKDRLKVKPMAYQVKERNLQEKEKTKVKVTAQDTKEQHLKEKEKANTKPKMNED